MDIFTTKLKDRWRKNTFWARKLLGSFVKWMLGSKKRYNDELFCFKVVLTFESVDEILRCDHSYGTSLPVPLHGAFCFSKINLEI